MKQKLVFSSFIEKQMKQEDIKNLINQNDNGFLRGLLTDELYGVLENYYQLDSVKRSYIQETLRLLKKYIF